MNRPAVNPFEDISKIRNRTDKNIVFLTDADTSLRDFYWRYDRGIEPYDSITKQPTPAPQVVEPLSAEEKTKYAGVHLYEVSFTNKGGLIMPIIVQFEFEDGTTEMENIPAQIWRKNENHVTKVFMTKKRAVRIRLDPMRQTADIDESNNVWPAGSEPAPSRFSISKGRLAGGRGGAPQSAINPMQNAGAKMK